MGKIISVINLKGGVGKTTTTVALAEFLALKHNKKVLVIDLDPQTNATVMLIKQQVWKKANDDKKTIHQMFLDRIENTKNFDLKESIIKSVSNIGLGVQNLDLLPSSIDLIDIQDNLTMIRQEFSYSKSPITTLAENLTQEIIEEYDFVLVDCPPNLGIVTLNGLYISDYYLIPVVPDILSTYGIPQILDRIGKCSVEIRKINRNFNIKPLGILVTKYNEKNRMHVETKNDLVARGRRGMIPKVLSSLIWEASSVSEATDINKPLSTLKQKYKYDRRIYKAYDSIANEIILDTCGI